LYFQINSNNKKGPFYICLNVIIWPLSILGLFFVVAKVSFWATFGGIILFFMQTLSYFLTFAINPGLPTKRLSLYDQLSIDRIIDNPYFQYSIFNNS